MQIVTDLDLNKWRDFVDNHQQSNIFQTSEMFEVYARAKRHQPNVWAVLGTDDQILALFLPVQITVLDRFFLRNLTSRAILYGSVLCAPTPEGHQALDLLLQTYNQDVKKQSLFTELRNLSDLSELQPVLSKNGLTYEEHLNFLIDLTLPKSDIWNAIQSNAQRNVRKARKSGVVIEMVEDQKDVAAAYAVLQKVYKRIQVPLPDRSLFQAAFEIMYPKGMFKIFLAKVEGLEVGALTLLLHKGVITYWYTGTLREFWPYRVSDLLVWHALEWGSENGFHTFDFGGGGRPGEEYGVRDFKLKFGGRQVNFGRNVRVHAPFKLQLSKWGYQLLRGIIP
jgi:serine/alanine adding enzyme